MTAPPLSALDLATLLGVDPPTEEQVRIIESPHDRSAAVIAGAGSGKTAVISLRVVWLVANGLVDADRILGLTFTRKAVGELNSRVRDYLGRYRRTPEGSAQVREEGLPGLDLPTVSTYNSYAAALVGDHGIGIGLEGSEEVLDAAARAQLIERILDSAAPDEVLDRSRSTMASWVSGLLSEMGDHLVSFEQVESHLDECLDALCTGTYVRGLAQTLVRKRSGAFADKAFKTMVVEQLRSLADEYDAADRAGRTALRPQIRPLLEEHDPVADRLLAKRRLVGLARQYAEAKAERGGVEFSDQVALAHRIMETSPAALQAERARWDVVLLDEFQDTSYAQFLMLQQIFGRHAVMAVGDPRQAIYGWRGASADNIESFPAAFRGPHDEAARKFGLTISWRNDAAVLDAANCIARGLPTVDERVGLRARPGAPEGAVAVSLTHSALPDPAHPEEPAQLPELVAWMLRARDDLFDRHSRKEEEKREAARASGQRPPRPSPLPTFAVLCRARSGFGPIAAALQDADLPVEVAGSHGLLDDPFVADALAILEVLEDPDAGDVLMRLLSGRTIRLGAADLTAFSAFVRASSIRLPDAQEPDGFREERIGIVEGLDELLTLEQSRGARRSDDGRQSTTAQRTGDVPAGTPAAAIPEQTEALASLTDEGRRRLALLARTLRRLRSGTLTLPGLVRAVIREAGIDTEVAALAPAYADIHTRALDSLLSLVARFAGEAPADGPREFLRWARLLEESAEIDDVPVDPVPGAVTIMTVHASKGLEFDAVAVPFLHDEGLPSKRTPGEGWLAQGGLPHALRGDRSGLPAYDLRDMDLEGPKDFDDRVKTGGPLATALDRHHLDAERRLAYVALTRARSHLFVSASRFTHTRKKPVTTGPFLIEVAQQRGIELPELPQVEELDTSRQDQAQWPVVDPEQVVSRRAELIRAVTDQLRAEPRLEDIAATAADPTVSALARRALHLTEATTGGLEDRRLPGRLSATSLVGLRADADDWWSGLRRPMPQPPSTAADLGTAFHAWVEQHYGQSALLDVEPETSGFRGGAALAQRMEELQRTFLDSRYALQSPAAVELSFELVLEVGESTPDRSGTAVHVPGKIDAVFQEADGGLLVVDWKTGRLPQDRERLDAMAVQLAMYRLAIAKMPKYARAPRIEAEFFFVGSDDVWRPEELPDETAIVDWLASTQTTAV